MEKSNFDRLIRRYLTGQVSEAEKIKIEAWLDLVKTTGTADHGLSKEDEEKIFQKITGNIAANELSSEVRKTSTTGWLLRIAAGLLILATAGYIAWYQIGRGHDRFAVTSSGPLQKVILRDGSLAWLRGKSKLVYFEKPEENIRYAEFEGEALFEVAKDARRPFIIHCGDAAIRVLGTSFNVRSHGDSLELSVLTGKVNVSSASGTGVDVNPAEKLVYIQHEMRKVPMQPNDAAVLTASTEYNMQFTNVTLVQVMERVGRKFEVTFTMEKKQTGQCRITADFTDRSLESTMELITEVLDVRYARNGTSITITGAGCAAP